MAQKVKNPNDSENLPPETPLATMLGWTAIIFGALPLVMGIHGDGGTYLGVGGIIIAAGIAAVLVGRFQRPSQG